MMTRLLPRNLANLERRRQPREIPDAVADDIDDYDKFADRVAGVVVPLSSASSSP